MLRHLLVLFPAAALVLPIVAAAKPLTTQVEESAFKPGKKPGKKPGEKPGEKPGGQPGEEPGAGEPGGESRESAEVELDFCATARALAEEHACELQIGDVCLAACDRAADDVAVCRSACIDDGATFCATRFKPGKKPGKKPAKPGTEPTEPGGQPTEPGGGATPDEGGGEQPTTPGAAPHEDDGLIFIDAARCASLGVIVDG